MLHSFPSVTIVIPVFNEERYLADCLDSLSKLDYPADSLEIIVVDNGSTDRSMEIAGEFPFVKIAIKSDVKVGAVRNYGASQAHGRVLIFLDSDCTVRPSWVADAIQKIRESSECVLGGQYLLRPNPSWLEKYWNLTNSDQVVYQTTLVGGCIVIMKSHFEEVGGFDESLNAGEDSELTGRLRAAGKRVVIEPSLSVTHLGFPSEITAFFNRQVWHSSDYVNTLPQSLTDKIFLLTLVFITATLAGLLFILIFPPAAFAFFTLSGACPLILSIKRITRARARFSSAHGYLSVYLVDLIYLIARSVGVLKGVKNALTGRQYEKVARR